MKRFICSTLATVVLLSLCACGSLSKEEMLATAITLDWDAVHDEYLANEARAKENYDGKIVKWTAKVYEIDANSAHMANETYNGLPVNAIDVHLSKDDLIKLDKYKTITIVGKLKLTHFSDIVNAYIVD